MRSPACLQCSLQYLPNAPPGCTVHSHDGCAHFLESATTHLRCPSTLRPLASGFNARNAEFQIRLQFAAMNRRDFLTTVAAGMAAVPLADAQGAPGAAPAAQGASPARSRTKLRQSVMASVWTGTNLSFEDRCKTLAR